MRMSLEFAIAAPPVRRIMQAQIVYLIQLFCTYFSAWELRWAFRRCRAYFHARIDYPPPVEIERPA
ncbi:MAG: hypothetical protein AMJ77_02810 [Dehalococcoidia bacterium SM23_28_2]|nr:MAG: hypothetical protein AMJ77_02810 [Dehalococcoidia bacterium SM23_28_2]